MPECPVCGKPLEPPVVKCFTCRREMHRTCAKRVLGRPYCKDCFKEAKKGAKFERMAMRSSLYSKKKAEKMW